VTRLHLRSAWLAASLGLAAAACGHKGKPLPPLRPIPAAVADFAAEREGAAVRLQFTVPDANQDGSAPPAVDRLDIFAVSRAATEPAPAAADVTADANHLATITVRADDSKPGAPPDLRPAAGEIARHLDPVTGVGAEPAAVRYYVVVPAAGRRRGRVSPVLAVPLGASPAAPHDVETDYTELTLTLRWHAAAEGHHFLVDETDEGGAGAKTVTSAPLEAPMFELPVAIGQRRCFTVRAVLAAGAVLVIGGPTPPVCVTPRDRFPPPVPAAFQAQEVDGAVELTWSAVTAADLAGYIVLRSAGPNGTLQRLTPTPITAVAFRDSNVRAGETYAYAVLAVDQATPPNESAPSPRQVIVARGPLTPVRVER